MTLYSHNGKFPDKIPHRINLSDGTTRTDPSQFTPEDIADAGYVEVPDPPNYDPEIQSLEWDGDWQIVPNFPNAAPNILSAPPLGFGGPTIKELFHGNR